MNVALGVTGCIAAYKSIEVMRGLQKAGVSVQVILTRAAEQFVTSLTFEALSGKSVITEMFRVGLNSEIEHIRLAQNIQLLAVVPATANALGKFAHGIADDFLSTLYLSTPMPVVLAPAMNVEMWDHPAVQANLRILRERGHVIVDPESGSLACGMEGEGRLAPVDSIVGKILALMKCADSLSGLKVLVTAGPTVEDLDPVRFLSNRSTGKMGYALAQAAHSRGAEVVLISGPTHLAPPAGASFTSVRSAAEMSVEVFKRFADMDIVIMAAAVSDFRPSTYHTQKIKKASANRALSLVANEDIAAELGSRKQKQLLIGFAAETGNVLDNARRKMQEKNLDMIVANDVSEGVFGADRATVHVLPRRGDPLTLADQSKLSIANRILDLAHAAWSATEAPSPAKETSHRR